MPDQELQERFDAAAANTITGTNTWAEFLVYRATMRAAQAQWDLAEDTKALNARVATLTLWLVIIGIATFMVGTVAAVAAIIAAAD